MMLVMCALSRTVALDDNAYELLKRLKDGFRSRGVCVDFSDVVRHLYSIYQRDLAMRKHEGGLRK